MKLSPLSINKTFWHGLASTSILILGVLLLLSRTWIFDTVVNYQLTLGPDAPAIDPWTKLSEPLYLDIYLFNWTNPEEINDPRSKPNFQEIGPFRFTEMKEKVNITWNDNATVTYLLERTWHFDEEGSPAKLSQEITTINMLLLTASKEAKNWNYWMKRGLSFSLGALGSQLHVTKTAKELIFDGYQEKLLDVAQSFSFLSDRKLPEKLGFMIGRNASSSINGVFNVATGAKGNSGELLNWNYENETNMYSGRCKKVHGSALDLFNQKLSRDHIDLFTTEVCTALRFYYEEDQTVKNIDGYKYSAGDKTFDNGTIVPENKCYVEGEIPTGVLNVTSCSGVEIFASLPHFYGADPIYLDSIGGLKPNKEKHDSFFTIEPRVGISLDLAFRFQMSFFLEPVEYVTIFERVPRVFIPTIWFEEKYVITDDLASSIKLLNKIPLAASILAGILITLGVVTLIYVTISNIRIGTMKMRQINMNTQKPTLGENKFKQEYFA